MSADLPLIGTTWEALLPFVGEEKCSACECLQGALMELRLSLEDLVVSPEQEQLLAAVGEAMRAGAPHACLGCQPCNPGDILANFYREQQARETASQVACCDAG